MASKVRLLRKYYLYVLTHISIALQSMHVAFVRLVIDARQHCHYSHHSHYSLHCRSRVDDRVLHLIATLLETRYLYVHLVDLLSLRRLVVAILLVFLLRFSRFLLYIFRKL
jgi:hypothetical protein